MTKEGRKEVHVNTPKKNIICFLLKYITADDQVQAQVSACCYRLILYCMHYQTDEF